jgi:hypothetical protein
MAVAASSSVRRPSATALVIAAAASTRYCGLVICGRGKSSGRPRRRGAASDRNSGEHKQDCLQRKLDDLFHDLYSAVVHQLLEEASRLVLRARSRPGFPGRNGLPQFGKSPQLGCLSRKRTPGPPPFWSVKTMRWHCGGLPPFPSTHGRRSPRTPRDLALPLS